MENIILTTSINPELLKNIYNASKFVIDKIVILTIDYKPIQIYNSNGRDKKAVSSKSTVLSNYDVAALVITTVPRTSRKSEPNTAREENTIFVLAQNVIKFSNEKNDIISLNGFFDIVPNDLLFETYKEFTDLKSVDLEKIEEFLDLSSSEPSLKAYLKLSSYFSEENYLINNNLFKLLKHKNESIELAKKILLKSIVAWQMKK